MGVSENSGTLFMGPYNKDPTIYKFRVLYYGPLFSGTPISGWQNIDQVRDDSRGPAQPARRFWFWPKLLTTAWAQSQATELGSPLVSNEMQKVINNMPLSLRQQVLCALGAVPAHRGRVLHDVEAIEVIQCSERPE